MDYALNSLTAALFYPKITLGNTVKFADGFNDRIGVELDCEPMVLPVQHTAPPEAPRIVLRSRERGYLCELSLNRVNFHFQGHGLPPARLEQVFPSYRETLYHVISAMYDAFPKIDRTWWQEVMRTFGTNRTTLHGMPAARQLSRNEPPGSSAKFLLQGAHTTSLKKKRFWLESSTACSSSRFSPACRCS